MDVMEKTTSKKRLIDAENTNLIDAIGRNAFKDRQDIIDLINNQPTVDAVEVVRCLECEHHYWEQEPCHGKIVHYCNLPHMSGVQVFKEFFCYYGERKEGADNG